MTFQHDIPTHLQVPSWLTHTPPLTQTCLQCALPPTTNKHLLHRANYTKIPRCPSHISRGSGACRISVSQVLIHFRTHARRYRPNREFLVILVRLQIAEPVTKRRPKLPQLNAHLIPSRTLLRPALHFTVPVHDSPAHLKCSLDVTCSHSPALP